MLTARSKHKFEFVTLAALLGLTLVFTSGCASAKLTDERNSLYQQNITLSEQHRADAAALADAQARIAALQAALGSVPPPPPPSTEPAPKTGLEGETGVDVGKTIRGEDVITLSGDVLFDSGKTTIKPAFKKTLDKVAAVMKTQYATHQFRIEGHTDSVPIHNTAWEDNWDLGAARARAVALYLMEHGVAKKAIYLASYADNEPRSPTNLAANRRVEIVVVK